MLVGRGVMVGRGVFVGEGVMVGVRVGGAHHSSFAVQKLAMPERISRPKNALIPAIIIRTSIAIKIISSQGSLFIITIFNLPHEVG